MTGTAATFRIVLSLLFVATATMCALLAIEKQGVVAVKIGWIAAILLLFAANPYRLPPFGVPAASLGFYRAAFGALTVLLVLASLFVFIFIQLPHERIPHYKGTVVRLIDDGAGQSLPEVSYDAADGHIQTFIDRIAPVMYPNRQFTQGERVSVIVVSAMHPRIDEPPLLRWSTPALVIVCTGFAAALTLLTHLRYIGVLK